MKISVIKGDVFLTVADLIIVPVFAGEELESRSLANVPADFRERLSKMAKRQDFKGGLGQTLLTPMPSGASSEDLLLVGLGEKKKENLGALREAVGNAIHIARRRGTVRLAIQVKSRDYKPEAAGAVAMAAHLASYTFDAFKKSSPTVIESLDIVTDDARTVTAMRKSVERTEMIARGVTLARNLVNMPAHLMTPTDLAVKAEELAKNSGKLIKVKILDREQCTKLGMGAYLAVAQGADHEPKFIHLTYTSPRPTKKTLAVIGKGVTFDSGGLSLKPADAMMTMKMDMAGGAAVLGFFEVLSKLKPRVNVHGIVAATENMPSGKAMRPGDVVKASNGKTIEILNTDAEGRLTLADALTYALKQNPDAIIDLATLTGACVVALGEEISGLMTNDRALGKQVLDAAAEAGEKMWEMPLEPRYRDLILSDISDYRNIPTSRYGGTLTAGLFLQEFTDGKPWVHLDIAGPAFAERPMASYLMRGATGHGVRTLVEFVEKF